MAGLTPAHLLIILVIALIVIGPGKLPEVGAAIGKSFREFQKATGQAQDPVTPPQPAVPAPVAPAQPMPPAQSYYAAPAAYPAQPYAPQPGYPPQYGAPQYPAPADPAAAQPQIAPAEQPASAPDGH